MGVAQCARTSACVDGPASGPSLDGPASGDDGPASEYRGSESRDGPAPQSRARNRRARLSAGLRVVRKDRRARLREGSEVACTPARSCFESWQNRGTRMLAGECALWALHLGAGCLAPCVLSLSRSIR